MKILSNDIFIVFLNYLYFIIIKLLLELVERKASHNYNEKYKTCDTN